MHKIRVLINGFGRIGRSVTRILLNDNNFELVAINDIYSFEQMAYLLKYDSIYPTLLQEIKVSNETLYVDKKTIKLYSESKLTNLHLKSLHIDIVLQCSGTFLTVESNLPLIENGVKRVIVSTPATDDMPNYIMGVNHKEYKQEAIISNSSCSANAIVPIFQIIDKYFSIKAAMMSMYHSYTSYQYLLDNKHHSTDIRHTRSATQNTIPLNSSAAKATAYFFPHLRENLHAKSIRVPIPATTLYDLSIKLDGSYKLEEITQQLQKEIENSYKDILQTTKKDEESQEYIQNPHSASIILPLTSISGENLLRISAWQDNEYGYAKRLVDMARVVTLR
jgi:glyceraldehyde 3-phosphate dehydrogenase